VRRLILARHGHAASNAGETVSSVPPGEGLSARGREEALALRDALAGESIALGVATELVRTQETLALAFGDRAGPRIVLPLLNEIRFGRFEGGPLSVYREWAWATAPDVECPGGGESRAAAALRIAAGLEEVLGRAEETVLHVGHSLPIRYVLDASDGRFPAARIERVGHAVPHALEAAQVERAAETLRRWSADARFRA
jgi:probable phosphoglycerate mutase